MYPALPTRMVHWRGVCRCTMYIIMYLPWYVTCALVHDNYGNINAKKKVPASLRARVTIVKIAKKTPTLVQRKLVRPWPDHRPDRFRRPCYYFFLHHGTRHHKHLYCTVDRCGKDSNIQPGTWRDVGASICWRMVYSKQRGQLYKVSKACARGLLWISHRVWEGVVQGQGCFCMR